MAVISHRLSVKSLITSYNFLTFVCEVSSLTFTGKKKKVKSACEPSGPSGRSLSRFQ